jgi:ribosomal protein S18 acetylase RimI-like enzyme
MDLIIREPVLSDVEKMLNYINELITERTYILLDKIQDIDSEREWVRRRVEDIENKKVVHFVAEDKKSGKIVGGCDFLRKEFRESHIVEMGISVLKDYRGKGIGKRLFNRCYSASKELWGDDVKFIRLKVFENNQIAINFYRKLGFEVVAKLPNAIKWNDGKLIGCYVMMREF